MTDLSQYISIAAVLDNSGVSPVIRIVDSSAYPAGVAQTIAGILSITQPDMVTIANTDFTHPDVFWQSGALVQPSKALRLANNLRFQNGGYTIKYSVRAPGYTDTILTKTFVLNYNAPVQVLTEAFDNFTPSLGVTDATVYGQSGFNFVSVTRSWAGIIRSVNGTNQNIVGSNTTFDLAYSGQYYDAAYDIVLTSVPTWQVQDVSPWVTIVDKLITSTQTFTAEIPPTLSQLLDGLTALKAQVDAAQNNGNIYGNSIYGNLVTTYDFASSIYSHLVERGSAGKLAGLSAYVYQLQTIFNNGVTPTYVNTNQPIPAYNWGGSSSSTAWSNITGKPATVRISWTVGQNGFPAAGSTSITDNRMAGIPLAQITMYRGNLPYFSCTKASDASNQLTWPDVLVAQETVVIQITPL